MYKYCNRKIHMLKCFNKPKDHCFNARQTNQIHHCSYLLKSTESKQYQWVKYKINKLKLQNINTYYANMIIHIYISKYLGELKTSPLRKITINTLLMLFIFNNRIQIVYISQQSKNSCLVTANLMIKSTSTSTHLDNFN